ncbi:dienelactone hydrolase family protein [Chloroflexota bacterium]
MNALQECLFVSSTDDYKHGFIGSRELLRQAELIAGSYEAAAEILGSLGFSAAELWARDEAPTAERPQAPSGVTVKPDDPGISVSTASYQGDTATLSGYVARPQDTERHPGIIVIHENKGLTEHIKDVARRFAKAGYAALAPDLLARIGGTDHFTDLDELSSSLRTIPPDAFIADLNTALDYLQGLSSVHPDRLGVTGYCFGGGLAWRLLTMRQDLKAGVPFYGAAPPADDVPKIKAAVLAIYGELDERINASIPDLEKAINESGVRYEKIMYPGAAHAFHNDTGVNFHPEAAKDAWAQTLAHFAQYLV